MNELATAIYNKSQEPSTFKTLTGGRLSWDKNIQVSQGEVPDYPYVVCHEITDDYWATFNEDFQEVRIQMNIYSNSASLIEVGNIYNALIDHFDWCILTVSDYRHLKMQRLFKKRFWDQEKNEYIITVDYSVQLQKT